MNPIKRIFYAKKVNAYRALFSTDDGREVLKDLAYFCFANRDDYHTEASIHANRAGRRAAFLRITSFLDLSEDEVRAIYKEAENDRR